MFFFKNISPFRNIDFTNKHERDTTPRLKITIKIKHSEKRHGDHLNQHRAIKCYVNERQSINQSRYRHHHFRRKMISTGHRIPLGSQQQLNLCCPHLATSCDFTSSLSVSYFQSCIICLFLYCNLLIKYHMYVDIIPSFLSELSGIGIPKPPRK